MQFHPCDATHGSLYGFRIVDIHRVGRTEDMFDSKPVGKADDCSNCRGSCTSSNARQRERLMTETSTDSSGCSNTASTCWGVFSRLARESSSSETSVTSSTAKCLWAESHSEVAIRKRQRKCPSKSPTSFGPSARNTLSALRFFFNSSERILFNAILAQCHKLFGFIWQKYMIISIFAVFYAQLIT